MVANEDNRQSAKANNESESLAQRRARLRGTLTKQAVSSDPFGLAVFPSTAGANVNQNIAANNPNNNGQSNSSQVDNQQNVSNQQVSYNQSTDYPAEPATFNQLESQTNEIIVNNIFDDNLDPMNNYQIDHKTQNVITVSPELALDLANNEIFDHEETVPQNLTFNKETPTLSNHEDLVLDDASLNFNLESNSKNASVNSNNVSTKSVKTKNKGNSTEKSPEIVNKDEKEIFKNNPGLSQDTLAIIQNLDLGVDVCATNIAQIHHMIKEFIETKSNSNVNSLGELGVNLTVLIDSLGAALEPLQAVGELVPAISELVSAIDSKLDQEQYNQNKFTPDELITNLADQLSNGLIDPWTFKCAYTSIFPDDHPADLLHRLVELLGTQRLAGNLFRAAYDAVQSTGPVNNSGQFESMPNPKILKELDELKQANAKLTENLLLQEELLNEQLNIRDQELAEGSDELRIKFEDLNNKFSELNNSFNDQSSILVEKDSILQNKDYELSNKTMEVNQLKAQIEELKDQYKDMITNLQSELSKSATESANLQHEIQNLKANPTQSLQANIKPVKTDNVVAQNNQPAKPLFKPENKAQTIEPGFFDANPVDEDSPSLFDSGPARPMFDKPVQTGLLEQNNVIAKQTVNQTPKITAPVLNPNQPVVKESNPAFALNTPNPTVNPLVSPGASTANQMPSLAQGNKASTYDFSYKKAGSTTVSGGGLGSGNYGTGIRSQVFEVIVRQALEGQPWKETCVGPMTLNAISVEEVEAEVERRKRLLQK